MRVRHSGVLDPVNTIGRGTFDCSEVGGSSILRSCFLNLPETLGCQRGSRASAGLMPSSARESDKEKEGPGSLAPPF